MTITEIKALAEEILKENISGGPGEFVYRHSGSAKTIRLANATLKLCELVRVIHKLKMDEFSKREYFAKQLGLEIQ